MVNSATPSPWDNAHPGFHLLWQQIIEAKLNQALIFYRMSFRHCRIHQTVTR